MQIFIRSKRIKITPRLKEYIHLKLGRLSRYEKRIMELCIRIISGKEHSGDKKFRAEVNLHLPRKIILRAEEFGQTPEAAIDLVAENIERQIERHLPKTDKVARRTEK